MSSHFQSHWAITYNQPLTATATFSNLMQSCFYCILNLVLIGILSCVTPPLTWLEFGYSTLLSSDLWFSICHSWISLHKPGFMSQVFCCHVDSQLSSCYSVFKMKIIPDHLLHQLSLSFLCDVTITIVCTILLAIYRPNMDWREGVIGKGELFICSSLDKRKQGKKKTCHLLVLSMFNSNWFWYSLETGLIIPHSGATNIRILLIYSNNFSNKMLRNGWWAIIILSPHSEYEK